MESTDDVAHRRTELERCHRGNSGRDIPLGNLNRQRLSTANSRECKIDDLNEAITLHRAALELRPFGSRRRSLSLREPAICLSDRFGSQGAADDLEEAVRLGRVALALYPPGYPNRGVSLSSLACDLSTRFRKYADVHGLEKVIELHRAALELHPSGHSQWLSSLQNLAVRLASRYGIMGVAADLDSKKLWRLAAQH